MTFEPLFNAPFAIQFHVATIIPAAILGAFLLARQKGTALHRLLGKIWVALMVATSISTFFIHGIDVLWGYSPIHLLSLYVIGGSVLVVAAARRGDIRAHRQHVSAMYLGGIVVAGLFTLLPERIMSLVVFGGSSGVAGLLSVAVIAVLLVAAGGLALRESGWPARMRSLYRAR